ncbi:MAG: DsbA family oxidoreductase [Pontibacterium sp.]
MKPRVQIQFISDVMCPWCVVGLGNLKQALAALEDEYTADIVCQPFEINPEMVEEGEQIQEHLMEKYKMTAEDYVQSREELISRGQAIGFEYHYDDNSRIWNSFDAHRLLHWAQPQGQQLALKEALFQAHFHDNRNVSDHAILAEVAASVGLNQEEALALLASDQFADEVRQQEQYWHKNGVSSVPSIVINDKYLITGGQPAHVFQQAIANIMAEEAASA